MKHILILILLPLTFIVMVSSCDVPPPTPDCDFTNGFHDFDGIVLKYKDNLEKPFNWESDHDKDNPPDLKVDNMMKGVMTDNSLSTEDDPKITLTLTGVKCYGTEDRVYTDDNDVGFESLDNGPKIQAMVNLKLEIKSAEYNGTKCYWEREYIDVVGSGVHPTGEIEGVWLSSNKANDDGDERAVYVHASFNDYIYNYQ